MEPLKRRRYIFPLRSDRDASAFPSSPDILRKPEEHSAGFGLVCDEQKERPRQFLVCPTRGLLPACLVSSAYRILSLLSLFAHSQSGRLFCECVFGCSLANRVHVVCKRFTFRYTYVWILYLALSNKPVYRFKECYILPCTSI